LGPGKLPIDEVIIVDLVAVVIVADNEAAYRVGLITAGATVAATLKCCTFVVVRAGVGGVFVVCSHMVVVKTAYRHVIVEQRIVHEFRKLPSGNIVVREEIGPVG
jgi:hypothetical protein